MCGAEALAADAADPRAALATCDASVALGLVLLKSNGAGATGDLSKDVSLGCVSEATSLFTVPDDGTFATEMIREPGGSCAVNTGVG